MKKFLSLLLAAMMLLSCTTALAVYQNDTVVNELHEDWVSGEAWSQNDGDDNATIGAFDSVNYGDDSLNNTDDDNYDESAELGTEVWMQVTADGQIDVTVPLVLVFQTNIDGGYATTSDKYQILNNNNAEVVVTKLEFNKTALGDGNDLMDIRTKKSTETTPLKENEYWATLTASNLNTKQNTVYYNGTQVDTVASANPTEVKKMNAYINKTNWDNEDPDVLYNLTPTYDMYWYAYQKPAKTAGLFKLNKTEDGGMTPTATVIDVAMKTGRLTFVTQDEDETQLMNQAKGIHLLTTTYTVAIDTSNLYEYDIHGANGTELTAAGKDAQTREEVTSTGSLTVPYQNPAQEKANTINDGELNNAAGQIQ